MANRGKHKSNLIGDIVGMLKSRRASKKINKKFSKQQKKRLSPYVTLMGYNLDKAHKQIDSYIKSNKPNKAREYVDSQIKKIKK